MNAFTRRAVALGLLSSPAMGEERELKTMTGPVRIETVVAGLEHPVTGEERIALDARVRDVGQGPDGAVHVPTDADDGKLLRLTPSGPS